MGEGGRKTSLVAPGEDRVTTLMGEINSEPCFPFLLSVTPLNQKEKEAKMASAAFSHGAFSGNTVMLELNQSKMAAGRLICDDPCDVLSYLFCVAKNIISAYH